METVKHDVPDTLWVGFGRKDAIIIREPARFKEYLSHWMQPHKFKIKHVEFWPGFAWGTVKLESGEARNVLLQHVLKKPFRPDGEMGWVLNKFEKCIPVYKIDDSPVRSPSKKANKEKANKKTSVADIANVLGMVKRKSHKSRSTTASPATVGKSNGFSIYTHPDVLDLDDLPPLETVSKGASGGGGAAAQKVSSFEDEEDDSELRVKATISKVIKAIRVVEAMTKKHGVYKLSINDILGAAKYRPSDLTGAEIVIVLGPLKKNQRRRDFLWAELAEDWPGPTPEYDEDHAAAVEATDAIPIKEEALENAMINLKRFYKWSLKNSEVANRQIAALNDEVNNAHNIQTKVAVISDHLTLASQSFAGLELDDESMEELITSTRCSSAFSDVKRIVSNVEYDQEAVTVGGANKYRKSDIAIVKEMQHHEQNTMHDLAPMDDYMNDYSGGDPKNILNLSDSPLPSGNKSRTCSGEKKKTAGVFDLPTSRQTIKANADSYTVESSADIQIDMIYWQRMLHWLTIHHFDDFNENAKHHAKWVVVVWELAGITPMNLKSEILGHQQTVQNFCTRLTEMLEAKKSKIPFWNSLSISNVIHSTLCYLLANQFPAECVPRCMAHVFSTVPYANAKTGSLFQMRGYVDKYISPVKGLLMTPKGYVLFNTDAVVGKLSAEAEEEEEDVATPVQIGTHVLFNASKMEEAIEDDKRIKYYVATNVWIESDYQIFYDGLGKHVSGLHNGTMAKILHRANSNLSEEVILSMYDDGLSRVGHHKAQVNLKNLLVDKTAMDSLKPLVDFLRTRLELRLDMASNISLLYASMWARIGYDFDYLSDDFHSLHAIGSRGCVTYNWEKLLLNFKLPNCLEMGHLVRETLAFFSTNSTKSSNVGLMDGTSLYELAIKRMRVERHHQLLRGSYDEGTLWVPQPFQRTRLLEAALRSQSQYPDDLNLPEENSGGGGDTPLKSKQEVKVHPDGEEVLTFETNDDGSMDAELVDAIIKGTIAFKYRIKDNVWRIISKNGEVFPHPPDGWGDREYIPILKHQSPLGAS
jgi:hypothetical protein